MMIKRCECVGVCAESRYISTFEIAAKNVSSLQQFEMSKVLEMFIARISLISQLDGSIIVYDCQFNA